MIVNEELFRLEDQCQKVIECIKNSLLMKDYLRNKQVMEHSAEVKQLKQFFLEKKESYEKIASYGKYAPDLREKQRAIRTAKRQLDLNEDVAAFRLSETQLQELLDTIGKQLAEKVSDEVKIDAGSPFFETGKHIGCGGNCHASR